MKLCYIIAISHINYCNPTLMVSKPHGINPHGFEPSWNQPSWFKTLMESTLMISNSHESTLINQLSWKPS
jgi:hypothetical protein